MDPHQPTASTSSLQPSASSQPPPAFTQHLLHLNPTPHPTPFSGTSDLLTLFNLDHTYNTFLRPYLDPALTSLSSSSASAPLLPYVGVADSPAASPGIPGRVDLGKGKGKASSPAPAPPAAGGGLKITLGGIKFGSARPSATPGAGAGSPSRSPSAAPDGGASSKLATQKRLKMEKGFDWMIGDVLGLPPSQKRTNAPNYLQHLVLNPDPVPCGELRPFGADELREAWGLEKGGLAGFDMAIWEGRGAATAGGGEKKKKKKRKHDQHQQNGGGGDGFDPKKQRR